MNAYEFLFKCIMQNATADVAGRSYYIVWVLGTALKMYPMNAEV